MVIKRSELDQSAKYVFTGIIPGIIPTTALGEEVSILAIGQRVKYSFGKGAHYCSIGAFCACVDKKSL